jgi:bacterioferritin
MEKFAVQVYRKQIRAFRRLEIADKLKDAAANEQEHADALTKRIVELGGSLSRTGIIYQIAGILLGYITVLSGKVCLLKVDLFIEKHAVSDYGNFLQKVDFDEKSVALINRIVVDEEKHIETWNNSLKILKSSK